MSNVDHKLILSQVSIEIDDDAFVLPSNVVK